MRERSSRTWLNKVADNLRSQLTWLDTVVGLGASFAITTLLLGFQFQSLPGYSAGDIAAQEVRALQDFAYEDTESTERERETARRSVSALYVINEQVIRDSESAISQAFEDSRSLLTQKKIPPAGSLSSKLQSEILVELTLVVGDIFPEDLIPILLRQRFNKVLEGQVLKVLDTVLRGGIVVDLNEFLRHQRTGISIGSGSAPQESALTEAYVARDVLEAQTFLRQFHLEFSDLSAPHRARLVDFLETLLVPTLLYREAETLMRRKVAAAGVAPVQINVKKGKAIFRSGEEISPSMVRQLDALRNLQRPKSLLWQFFGFSFFVITFVYALWRYLVLYQTRHRKIRNHTLLILVVIFSSLVVMRLITALAGMLSERVSIDVFRDPYNIYFAIPFAFGAMLITLLVDLNLGMIISVVLSAVAGLFYGDIYLAVYALTGSLAGIYSMRQYKDRAAIITAGLTIGIVNIGSIFSICFLRLPVFEVSVPLAMIGFALISGGLAAALSSMLLPALESVFKITTDIRLLELSNLNSSVLRRLAVEAPGTYHHSLMVGTLAEAAAEAVGANPLLVRVAAYYHDIGKMLKPEYFAENQIHGVNKHESLSPNMSCLILASHVKDGLEMAKDAGLTETIRDMIPQHHGTRLMTYFYQKAKDSIDGKNYEISDANFRYPGPKPQSKEAAILMMSDSIEAASRTLNDPSPAQITGMMDRLVESMFTDNQFDECDITVREIRLVKETFKRLISGIFHRRIDYPGYDFTLIDKRRESRPLSDSGPKQAKAI